jgi:hypothetical protein
MFVLQKYISAVYHPMLYCHPLNPKYAPLFRKTALIKAYFIIYRIISTKHSVFSNMIFTGADPGFPVREGAFKRVLLHVSKYLNTCSFMHVCMHNIHVLHILAYTATECKNNNNNKRN